MAAHGDTCLKSQHWQESLRQEDHDFEASLGYGYIAVSKEKIPLNYY
jgi:hypothetical protein